LTKSATEAADAAIAGLIKSLARATVTRSVRMTNNPDDINESHTVIFQVGRPDALDPYHANGSGEMFRKTIDEHPTVTILLYIPGYDDDPRDLWDIPEVVIYVQQFAIAAKIEDAATLLPRIGEHGVGLLAACGVPSSIRMVHVDAP